MNAVPGGAPLHGWRVLVPRGGELGERAASLLTEAGAEPVVLPLLTFGPPSSPQALADAAARARAGTYDWIVFTSATAVTALVGASAPVALPDGVRVAAVGEHTAAALTAAGVRVDFVPTGDYTARALVDEWPDRRAGLRVLAPLSAIAAPTLVDGLRGHGLEVDAVEAYTTVIARPDAATAHAAMRDLRAVLVTSGSVARAIVEALPPLPAGTVVACIGDRTAREAREAGLDVSVIAARQTVGALVDALADAAQSGARPETPDLTTPTDPVEHQP